MTLCDRRGGARERLVEMIDARAAEQPRARRAASSLVHRRQDAALEVEIRPGIEARVAHWAYGFVQRDVAIRATLQARDAISLEEQLAVDVVGVLEEAIDRALDRPAEVGKGTRIRLRGLG